MVDELIAEDFLDTLSAALLSDYVHDVSWDLNEDLIINYIDSLIEEYNLTTV